MDGRVIDESDDGADSGVSPNPLPALQRLIESTLTVTDLVANPLWALRPDLTTSEAAAILAARRFDVAGVAADPITEYVLLDELRIATGTNVSNAAKAIPASLCVEQSLPLSHLLEHFRTRPFVFVLDRDRVRWVVTRADLRAPAVSAIVLAYLVVIEDGLRRLVLDECGETWIDLLPENRRESLLDRFAQLAGEGLEISLDLCAYFGDWLGLAGTNEAVRTRLGFASRTKFENETGSFDTLRNDVAHGRTIFDAGGIEKGLDRISRVRRFATILWSELDGSDRDWGRLVTTSILEGGRILAGPGAEAVLPEGRVHVVTAWNPGGATWPESENRFANDRLAEVLIGRDLEPAAVKGQSLDGRWGEESFAVAGASRSQMAEIGAEFDQRAIFELDGESLYVIRCPDGQVMRERPRRPG